MSTPGPAGGQLHSDGLGLAYLAASVVGGLAAFRGGRSAGMTR